MWQTTSKADFTYSYSSHEWLSSILSCGKHGTALQTGFVPRLRLCWRPWGLKINLRWCLVYFRKSNFCHSKLDVQETSFCFAQLYRVWSCFSGCWITNGWVTCSWCLGHRDWSFTFNQRQYSTQTYWPPGNWGSSKTKTQHVTRKQKVDQLSDVDHIHTNTPSFQIESQLYIFEDNEAVIKMITKGRSPTMKHVSRTHRVALDWWFNRINLEPKIQIKYVDTKNQLADILTKGSFSRDEWSHLLCLFNIMRFTMYSCSHFIKLCLSLRIQSALCLVQCRNEDRAWPRTMAHRRRKQDPLIWWCTVSAERKSRHKVRDLWSIQGMITKEKELAERQETGDMPTQIS